MLQLAKGIINTVEAIKAIDPDSIMVHVEATGLTRSAREDLAPLAIEEQRRGYICYDLITGRLTHEHPLFPWLARNGISFHDLEQLGKRKVSLDVVGLNFYPQWSTKQLFIDKKGRLAYRNVEQDGVGFASLIEDYYRRYNAPIMITETSAVGPEDVRSRWLEASVAAIRNLRGHGVPVLGYTWFPLFTMIDWRYRFGRRPVEQYRLELGIFRTNETGLGRWSPTPLADQFRSYVSEPEDSIGNFVPAGAHRPGAEQVG